MASAKCRLFRLGLDLLNALYSMKYAHGFAVLFSELFLMGWYDLFALIS